MTSLAFKAWEIKLFLRPPVPGVKVRWDDAAERGLKAKAASSLRLWKSMKQDAGTLIGRTGITAEGGEKFAAHAPFIAGEISARRFAF